MGFVCCYFLSKGGEKNILLSKGGFMNNFSEQLLLLILIGVFANANDVDLANNTTILLLLALILFNGSNNTCGCGCNTCRNNSLFTF